MKINTSYEHHLALIKIEQLLNESKGDKELLKLLEAIEDYEENQELILVVSERLNQSEIRIDLDDL